MASAAMPSRLPGGLELPHGRVNRAAAHAFHLARPTTSNHRYHHGWLGCAAAKTMHNLALSVPGRAILAKDAGRGVFH